MDAADLMWLDAVEQARLVATGEVSAAELRAAAIECIEALNPALNAVVTPLFDAPEPKPGPFAGVPTLLKDYGGSQAGLPHYMGNRLLRRLDFRAEDDAPVGARLRAAGFVTLGKTNTPEFGRGVITQPLSFGPTANPWRPDLSPAGSSGGAAAAVASGMVAVAHASDGGGSIRAPAAWCGLVGLKPSRGRTSNGPASTDRAGVEHVLTRSVRDTAAALDVLAGPGAGRPLCSAPARPRLLGRPRGRAAKVDRGRRHRTRRARGRPRLPGRGGGDGAPAGRARPPGRPRPGRSLGRQGLARPYGGAAGPGLPPDLPELVRRAGRPLTDEDVEPYLLACARQGELVTLDRYAAATQWQQDYTARVHQRWPADVDVMVTPATGCPAMKTADLVPPDDNPLAITPTHRRIGGFAAPFNITGHPAISLPLHWHDGLPVGVQLVAHIGREATLIHLAAELEAARPWSGRRPPPA